MSGLEPVVALRTAGAGTVARPLRICLLFPLANSFRSGSVETEVGLRVLRSRPIVPKADSSDRHPSGDSLTVRTLLLLLVAPALLMPPGMCICQFVPCGEMTGSGSADPSTLQWSGTSAAANGCTCSHGREGSTGLKTGYGSKAEHLGGCPAGGEKPCPSPGKPWPDCPVVTGTAPDKFTTPSPVLVAWDLASVAVWSLEVTAVPTGRIHYAPFRLASSPIFIRQCSLVI